FIFFFQAEDGIRDDLVTGVQTCALPISLETYVEQPDNATLLERCAKDLHQVQGVLRVLEIYGAALLAEEMEHVAQYLLATHSERSEERRVGKECRLRESPYE